MRTKKTAIVLTILLCGALPFAYPQDTNSASKADAPKSSEPKPAVAYRVDFSINELEDGKKINTRHYSMNLMGERKELKINTRVPVQSGVGQFQYLDIGTNINAHLETSESPIILDAVVEFSNLAISDSQVSAIGPPPSVRLTRIGTDTIVVLGKPMIVGSVDDLTSKRQFQLEVLVSKLP
jgi:hypothetical protein